jgi:hypothetical protein
LTVETLPGKSNKVSPVNIGLVHACHHPQQVGIGAFADPHGSRVTFQSAGAPSFTGRRADLIQSSDAIFARKSDIAAKINADFGHRSHPETATTTLLKLVLSIDRHRSDRIAVAWSDRVIGSPVSPLPEGVRQSHEIYAVQTYRRTWTESNVSINPSLHRLEPFMPTDDRGIS